MESEIEGRDVSNVAVRMTLDLLLLRSGEDGVTRTLAAAGETRPRDQLNDDAQWSSYRVFRRLLEAAASELGGIDALTELARTVDLVSGTMPSTTEMLQALGSPNVLFAEVVQGRNGMITFIEPSGEQVGPTEWVLGQRMKPGFEPFPEFCAFSAGILPLTPRLFGYDEFSVVEERCQHRGDANCEFRVRWEEGDDEARQRAALEQRIVLLERRLETFQDTVAELVLADDVDTALDLVVTAAARAMRAQGYVLTVEPLNGHPARVRSHGLNEAEAERVAALLVAGQPCPEVRDLVVEITSNRRRYGLLAAYDPHSIVHADRGLLNAYARLAATVLDSATSLEEARQEAARGAALLSLSAALSDIDSMEGMARSLARATPVVIGADRAAVTVADWDHDVARVVGCHGYSADVEAQLMSARIPLVHPVPTEVEYIIAAESPGLTPLSPSRHDAVAHVIVPIMVDGRPEGWLTANVVDHPERLAPTAELEARMIGLAAQASSALRNTRLVEQIRHQALHDALTALPNRTLILDRAAQLLARSRRDHRTVTALFLDLDGFKDINDSFGHAVGDQLLQSVANRLAATIRDGDTLGRLGGDEFVVLVDDLEMDQSAGLVAQRLLDVLEPAFVLDGIEDTPVVMTASIGLAVATEEMSAGDLLRDADVALYQAKASGKNRSVVFATEMRTAVRDRRELDADLRSALSEQQYFLEYQPIFDLATEEINGVEALVRWNHPVRGVVMPDDFIPALEDSGLIVAVGAWVLTEACRQAASWTARGHHLDIAVNMSARQLETERIIDDVRSALASSGLDPTSLVLEITETAIMRDTEMARNRLGALKQLGVRLAIDDFGTGYSSLAYLQQFPVDSLKIDRSFVNAVASSPEAAALIHTFVGLGQALGLEVLAEGIEDTIQLAQLREQHCDNGQGFLLARPLAAGDIEALLDKVADANGPPTRGPRAGRRPIAG